MRTNAHSAGAHTGSSTALPSLEESFVQAGVIRYGHFWTYAGCQRAYVDCLALFDGHAGLLYRSLLALRHKLPRDLADDVVFAGIGDGSVFAAFLAQLPFMRLPGYVPGAHNLDELMAQCAPRFVKMARSESEQRAVFVRDQGRIVKNRDVIFVDDVLSSGRTAKKAGECILEAGGRLVDLLVLVNTSEKPEVTISIDQRPFELKSVVHLPIPLYLKSNHERDTDCPDCAKRVPFDNSRLRS